MSHSVISPTFVNWKARSTRSLALAEFAGRPLSLLESRDGSNDKRRARGSYRQITSESVMDAVSAYFKASFADLRGRSRAKEIVLPRQIAMYSSVEKREAHLCRYRESSRWSGSHHGDARNQEDRTRYSNRYDVALSPYENSRIDLLRFVRGLDRSFDPKTDAVPGHIPLKTDC